MYLGLGNISETFLNGGKHGIRNLVPSKGTKEEG